MSSHRPSDDAVFAGTAILTAVLGGLVPPTVPGVGDMVTSWVTLGVAIALGWSGARMLHRR